MVRVPRPVHPKPPPRQPPSRPRPWREQLAHEQLLPHALVVAGCRWLPTRHAVQRHAATKSPPSASHEESGARVATNDRACHDRLLCQACQQHQTTGAASLQPQAQLQQSQSHAAAQAVQGVAPPCQWDQLADLACAQTVRMANVGCGFVVKKSRFACRQGCGGGLVGRRHYPTNKKLCYVRKNRVTTNIPLWGTSTDRYVCVCVCVRCRLVVYVRITG